MRKKGWMIVGFFVFFATMTIDLQSKTKKTISSDDTIDNYYVYYEKGAGSIDQWTEILKGSTYQLIEVFPDVSFRYIDPTIQQTFFSFTTDSFSHFLKEYQTKLQTVSLYDEWEESASRTISIRMIYLRISKSDIEKAIMNHSEISYNKIRKQHEMSVNLLSDL